MSQQALGPAGRSRGRAASVRRPAGSLPLSASPLPFFPVIGSGKADISEQSIYQSGLKSQIAG